MNNEFLRFNEFVKNISKNSLVYIFGDFLTKGINFLLIPLYTKLLSTSDYGISGVLNSLTAFLTIFFSFQLSSVITINYYKINQSERKSLIYTITLLTLLSTVFFLSLSLFFGQSVFGNILKEIPYKPYVILAIGAAAFSGPIEIIKANLRIKEKSFIFVLFGLLQFLVNLCFTIYFIVVLNLGALGLILSIFISNFLIGFLSLFILIREAKSEISHFLAKEAILLSIPIILHMVSHWGLNLMDRLILQSYVPLSEIGIYQLGYQVGTIYQVFIISINNAWVPFFFQKKGIKDYEKIIQKISTWLILLQLFIASFIILYNDELFRLLINAKYYNARLIVPYIVLGFVFVTFYHMWVNILFFQKKTKLIPISTILAVITNYVINIILIPKFGIIGSAIATAVSYSVLAIIVLIFSIKLDTFRFEYKKWFKIFLSGFTIVFISMQINYKNLNISFLMKFLFLLLWPLFLSLLKFWDKKDFQFLNKFGMKYQKIIYHLFRK